MEDVLIEVPTILRFVGIDTLSDRIPDKTTILAFRHLLERHNLGKQIYCSAEDFVYETVKARLRERGMAMKPGTVIDATLIAALNSTRNLDFLPADQRRQARQGPAALYPTLVLSRWR